MTKHTRSNKATNSTPRETRGSSREVYNLIRNHLSAPVTRSAASTVTPAPAPVIPPPRVDQHVDLNDLMPVNTVVPNQPPRDTVTRHPIIDLSSNDREILSINTPSAHSPMEMLANMATSMEPMPQSELITLRITHPAAPDFSTTITMQRSISLVVNFHHFTPCMISVFKLIISQAHQNRCSSLNPNYNPTIECERMKTWFENNPSKGIRKYTIPKDGFTSLMLQHLNRILKQAESNRLSSLHYSEILLRINVPTKIESE